MTRTEDSRPVRSRHVSINGRYIDLAGLEATLREGSPSKKCVVLQREATNRIPELVACVVPAIPYAPDRLEARVNQRCPRVTCVVSGR